MPDLRDRSRLDPARGSQDRRPHASVDGVCAGAGAILAMASDLRYARPQTNTAFLFTCVGLAEADMGACGILPRIIRHGRAAELLYTGRAITAGVGFAWGLYNRLNDAAALESVATALARRKLSYARLARMAFL